MKPATHHYDDRHRRYHHHHRHYFPISNTRSKQQQQHSPHYVSDEILVDRDKIISRNLFADRKRIHQQRRKIKKNKLTDWLFVGRSVRPSVLKFRYVAHFRIRPASFSRSSFASPSGMCVCLFHEDRLIQLPVVAWFPCPTLISFCLNPKSHQLLSDVLKLQECYDRRQSVKRVQGQV